ncbi:MAG: tetratricopeptide repeat protein [Nannocystaceae bacterium]|nr:tetratricopeptide repeat protein [Nannocystaceae bacterium]
MNRICFSRILAFVLCLPVVSGSATTWAGTATQPGADSGDADVVALDAQANAAYQAGAFESAAKLFVELYTVTDDPNYLYNLSVCYDRTGRLQEALDALNEYAANSPDHDSDAVLAKRQGLEIRIEAAGREDGDTEEEAPADAASPASSETPTADVERNGRSKPLDVAGGITLGLGVTGVAVGIGLGLAANKHKDSVEADCVMGELALVCSDGERTNIDKARSFALGADISLAVGGVLAATGVALLIVNTVRAKKKREPTMSVAPAVGRQLTGLAVFGRF